MIGYISSYKRHIHEVCLQYVFLYGHVLKGETSKRNDRNETAETTETKRPKRNDRNETTETKRPKRNDRNETKRPKRNSRKYKLQEKWKTLKLMKFTGNFIEILRQLGCGSTGL
jgi:hypothetical protein